MINPNWDRWIAASIGRYFKDNITSLPLFFEGQLIDQAVITADHLEFRVNGPDIYEISKNNFEISVGVNILCVLLKDTDLYKDRRIAGLVASTFAVNICINKLGDGVDDDGMYLGTMILCSKPPVEIDHFGVIDSKMGLIHATVNGMYKMNL